MVNMKYQYIDSEGYCRSKSIWFPPDQTVALPYNVFGVSLMKYPDTIGFPNIGVEKEK